MKKLWLVLLSAVLLTALFAFPAMAEETPPVCETYNEAVLYVRQQLKNRETSFSFTYTGEDPIDIEDVLAYEGSAPDEGDYLRWNISHFIEKDYEDGECEFSVSYRSTLKNEQAVTEAIPDIISGITGNTAPASLTEYRKALLLYDWLCDNVTYSEAEGGYSAYNALVKRNARCEGYALAYYRLARELGLDCRVMAGALYTDDMEASHAWNAVRIRNSWYCLDAAHGAWNKTADHTAPYGFFMIPTAWSGVEYRINYPDGSSSLQTPSEIADYTFNEPIYGRCENSGWTLDPITGILTLTAKAHDNALQTHWTEYIEKVHAVTIADAEELCRFCLQQSGLPLHCNADSAIAAEATADGIPIHTPHILQAVPATCKDTGTTTGTGCEICGVCFSGGEPLPITDNHTDDGTGTCTVCGIAIDCVDHGFCGRDIRWYLLNSGELVITGTGKIKDFKLHCPWEKYLYDIRSLTVQEGITEIGYLCFSPCHSLTEVRLPDSLIEIGPYAFHGCIKLRDFTFPANLSVISSFAFSHCESLDRVILPSNLKTLGKTAFSNAGLKYVFIPASLSSVIPNNRSGPFAGSSLETIEFEDGTTVIPDYCGSDAINLKNVILPDSVTEIGSSVFYSCTAISDIELPNGLKLIGNFAFYNCKNLSDIELPSSVETIGYYAFQGTSKLLSIRIPASVKNWRDAFPFSSVQTIILEDGLTTIPDYAFWNCFSLSSVFIPKSIKKIGNSAFQGCNALCDVSFEGTRLSEISFSAFIDCPAGIIFHCPPSTDAYDDNSPVNYAKEHGFTCHTDLDFNGDIMGTLCNGKTIDDFYAYCRDCEQVITRSGTVNAAGHITVTDAAVAPTCTQDGKTEGSHCSVCHTVFTAQETVPALGHRDTLTDDETPDGVCDVCGGTLWTKPEDYEGAGRQLTRIAAFATSLLEGLAKALSNLIKLFRQMFGK